MKQGMFRKGLTIFILFFKIGFFTFGSGWSIIAQVEQEFVHKRGWLTSDDLLDLIAVGRSMPGIMVTNVSMLFGYSTCGWFGGICAVLGLTCPAVIILTAVAYGYDMLKDNIFFNGALKGIRAAVVPIMGGVVLSMAKGALKNARAVTICIIAFLLCMFTDISNVILVVSGIILSLVLMKWDEYGQKRREQKK